MKVIGKIALKILGILLLSLVRCSRRQTRRGYTFRR